MVSSLREITATLLLNLPLGITNEGREAIKLISGAVVGDSSLQDRGVAHYLLSLLFSLVSYLLVFTFVSLIKNTKNTYYLSCLVKHVRIWYYEPRSWISIKRTGRI